MALSATDEPRTTVEPLVGEVIDTVGFDTEATTFTETGAEITTLFLSSMVWARMTKFLITVGRHVSV